MPVNFCKGFYEFVRQFIGFAVFICLLVFELNESAIDKK